ncbi:MAG: class I adenylate-forming enzyme family protein [Candidatus Eiseniibacteriota bacterium]
MAAAAQIGRSTVTLDPALPDYPTLIHALAEAARRAPDRTALICGDKTLDYAGYLRAVAGFARRLAGHGVAGERVAVLMSNSIEMAVAMLGAMAARAQMAPINPFYTERELKPLLADAAPRVLVVDAASAAKGRALAGALGIPHVEEFAPGALAVETWVGDAALTLPEPLPGPDDWATLPYSGGTTGVPKGVNHKHRNLVIFFRQFISIWRFDFDVERFLNVAPMFHIWGFLAATWTPIYMRGTLVIMPKFEPEAVLEAFERHKVTIFMGGPASIYMGLMAHPRFAKTDFSNLRLCLAGGSACPEQMIRDWEAVTGCILLEGLGMSEGAPIANNPLHGERKFLSVGIVPPLTEIDIVDLETGDKVLGPGETGEVRVRGPQFTQGYRNRPEENAQALRHGWLYTGDIGYFDADGYLFLVDRKKDMVNVGGYNVFPREIDELMFRHPKIREAAAVGVADPRLGERIAAFVVLAAGQTMTEDEFFAYCAENLVKYKRPTTVAFVEALPKTGAGKINRRALRTQA